MLAAVPRQRRAERAAARSLGGGTAGRAAALFVSPATAPVGPSLGSVRDAGRLDDAGLSVWHAREARQHGGASTSPDDAGAVPWPRA